ncbi:hypothetical protein J6590_085865 [Homalodisca vitripennis]|nr:hypothetical protein J6590_085865 [Homalodisca vitripennis]
MKHYPNDYRLENIKVRETGRMAQLLKESKDKGAKDVTDLKSLVDFNSDPRIVKMTSIIEPLYPLTLSFIFQASIFH